MHTKRFTEEVYFVDEPVVSFGLEGMDFLKKHVYQTERKRVRICMHKGVQEKLHEMFVCYVKETYVRPNRHTKDESLHIVEGSADFIFFDDHGSVTKIVPLGDYESGKNFYCRVPKNVYHTLIITSDIIVIHESIPGPFRREDTEFASWGPEESQVEEVGCFLNNLSRIVANQSNFLAISK